MNIENIKKRLEQHNIMRSTQFDQLEPQAILLLNEGLVADVAYLLSIVDQIEYLTVLKDFAEKRREINLYLGTVYYGLEEALKSIKGEE